MRTQPHEMLQEFVGIPSPTGFEAAFTRHLRGVLADGFDYDHLEVQYVAANRHNLLMVKGKPRMMLTSHLDTVPTAIKPRVAEGVLYGTGACDAKGQIAAQLGGLQLARQQGLTDYGCFYVIGEEVDSSGAEAIIKHPLIQGDYVLNGEPTSNRFVNRSKGVIEATARAAGKEQHSSIVPFDSAVHKMIGGLQSLIGRPPAGATVNVGRIEGGTAANVSAAAAEAAINLRIARASRGVLTQTRSTLGKDLALEVTNVIEPFTFHVPAGYEKDAIDVPYCSDAPYYAARFKHVLMAGPGDIAHAHNIHEQVKLGELNDAAEMIGNLLLRAQRGGL